MQVENGCNIRCKLSFSRVVVISETTLQTVWAGNGVSVLIRTYWTYSGPVQRLLCLVYLYKSILTRRGSE